MKLLDRIVNRFYTGRGRRMRSSANLENGIAKEEPLHQEAERMAKKIKRKVVVNGCERWISADTEQEYAEKLMAIAGGKEREPKAGHNLRNYAQQWFEVYSKPNIEAATAATYERELRNHIFPIVGNMNIEDVTPDDLQKIFNSMDTAKSSKDKTRMVLNMIFGMAQEDGLISKNPTKSRHLRITGRASEPTEEYSIEQMRYLVGHLRDVRQDEDRYFLALMAMHPLRLEEALGLKWEDVSKATMRIEIRRAVTHPTRNQPEVKPPKTKASARSIALSNLAADILGEGPAGEYILGGSKPYSYSQVRRMCDRIRADTGFAGRITPIRFRTTVLTDIYDQTKDIKQTQAAAGHTTATMTLKHYVKGRGSEQETAVAIERVYGMC